MDKQTLSNYGWLVIVTLILAVMLALATPCGTYVGDAVVSVANGFVGTSNEAIDEDNIAINQDKWEDKFDYNGLSNYNHNASELHPGKNDKIIPEGAYYGNVNASTGIVTWYDEMPSTVSEMDIYVYQDYIYMFSELFYNTNVGWNVTVTDTSTLLPQGFESTDRNQSTYKPILESINGKPIAVMNSTFYNCTQLTDVPEIPSGVINMIGAFDSCTSLKTAPTIPNGVIDMSSTFKGCTSLTTAPKIPNSVTDMDGTFSGCTALKVAPNIPNNMDSMCNTFEGCTSLTTAPTIPSSVRHMLNTFAGCTSLTGSITINATPTYYTDCIKSTNITQILGDCTIKSEILATK